MTKSDHKLRTAAYLERLTEAGSPGARFAVHSVLDVTVTGDWGRRGAFVIGDCHLLYVRGGRPIYHVDGREMPLAAGHVLFAGRGTRIQLDQDRKDPPRIVPVRFDRYCGDEPCRLNEAGPAGIALRPRHPERFEALFDALCAYWMREHEPAAVEGVSGLISAILFGLLIECRSVGPKRRQALEASMETVRLLMEREPESNWSVGDLAERVNLSESFFSRRFREYAGVSPKVYQLRSRMRFARFLLEQERASVKEVAARLGYSDAFVFSRQFRKVWGAPPSKLRS